ncbi:hypothetical protein NE236_32685 [Actinoallomurus purpureus]|uniref:hypothetical protein n=1 Tax=Actinoallomurus purpureus TaxID=478114 RepID=UPI0020920574|nr:hypothetical protein [Actinoallomurus purpureus]MCO6009738.1 hypothetical protein [Actinoallomurus purpureus]
MKKVLMACAAAAAFTAAGIALPASASATPTAPQAKAAALKCSLYTVKANYNVQIRKTKSVKATSLGVLPHGKSVCSDKWEKGGKYTYKGSCKDVYGWKNWWDHITYHYKKNGKKATIKGWVPSTCLKGYR